jgi:2-isopropylmalate synthase
MLKSADTFEIMRPSDVGLAGTSLPLGKHSGRAALRAKLKDLGFDMVDNQLNDLFVRFKALADRKKEVFDDDLIALVTDAAAADQDDHLELKFLRVICGTEAPQSADITLRVGEKDRRRPRRATARWTPPSTRSRRSIPTRRCSSSTR